MKNITNLILGAGIAGLAAGQHLEEMKKDYLILEENSHFGGLCSSYNIDGFIYDYFIHMSFTNNECVRKYFDQTSQSIHTPNPFNYYHGTWIKHPAQNNLFPLEDWEKQMVLNDLNKRGAYKEVWKDNYENWLRYQFGDYFAEHFPIPYTRKYWVEEAKNMETEWVGNRIYQPSMEEIYKGMQTEDTPVTYYAKKMRYPIRGGFGEYLKVFDCLAHIKLNERVISIDLKSKIVTTNKEKYCYTNLFSSIALPELSEIIVCSNDKEYKKFCSALKDLHWTSGYLVSLGIEGKILRQNLWNYIYDEDIYVSRYYSPSQMSQYSAPNNCYSIQAEIYTKDGSTHLLNDSELLEKTIVQLDRIGAINKERVIVKDIRYRKYCNIIFDKNIYKNREVVLSFLRNYEVVPIGRFGEWKYFWSDQSFMSGYHAV